MVRYRGRETYAELAKDGRRYLGRIRVPSHGALDDDEPQAPNVTLHAVGPLRVGAGLRHTAARDALGGHVALAADVGLGDGGHEIAADAEVAVLVLALRVDEDVGGLFVVVVVVVFVLQRLEAHDGGVRDPAQHVLGDAAAVQLVDGPAVHVLDAHVDGALLEEGAVEVDDVGRDALVQDDKLLEDSRELGFVQLEADLLHGHDHARGPFGTTVGHGADGRRPVGSAGLVLLRLRRLARGRLEAAETDAEARQPGAGVPHLVDGPVVALPQLVEHLDLVEGYGEGLPAGEVDARPRDGGGPLERDPALLGVYVILEVVQLGVLFRPVQRRARGVGSATAAAAAAAAAEIRQLGGWRAGSGAGETAELHGSPLAQAGSALPSHGAGHDGSRLGEAGRERSAQLARQAQVAGKPTGHAGDGGGGGTHGRVRVRHGAAGLCRQGGPRRWHAHPLLLQGACLLHQVYRQVVGGGSRTPGAVERAGHARADAHMTCRVLGIRHGPERRDPLG